MNWSLSTSPKPAPFLSGFMQQTYSKSTGHSNQKSGIMLPVNDLRANKVKLYLFNSNVYSNAGIQAEYIR